MRSLTYFLIFACLITLVLTGGIPVKLNRVKGKTNSFLGKSFLARTNISLTNYYNVQYSGLVYLGSENQAFNLIFDTGSPWLWVPEDNRENESFQSKYDCNKSLTCNKCPTSNFNGVNKSVLEVCESPDPIRDSYTFVYSSGTVEGYLVTDMIRFSPDQEGYYQTFLVCSDANILSGIFVDGICGLSLRNDKGMSTILDMMQGNDIIEDRIFSLYLNNNPEAYGDNSSMLILGGYDLNYAAGNFVHVHVIDRKDQIYWQSNLTGFYIGDASKEPFTSLPVQTKATTVVFDSGTSHIVMLGSDYRAFVSAFKSKYQLQCDYNFNKQFACACPGGSVSKFPNLVFEIDHHNFTIPPSLYLDIQENACIFLIDGSLSDKNINTNSDSDDSDSDTDQGMAAFIVLGDVFLRNYYSVFNADNLTIAFAPAATVKENYITTLELVYLILGIFILVLFAVFLVCFFKMWTMRKVPNKQSTALGTPMLDRTQNITSHYSQILNE
jgi:Eukaryotic aspartyl protease.